MEKRLDLKIWFACNNHCTFCVQWDKRTKFPPRGIEEIKEILRKERQLWVSFVVFTWGEPTVHPDLVEAVKYAHRIGYRWIQIQSNGTRFAEMDYVRELVLAGANQFAPSIHGFKRETHDALVWNPWAWEKVVKGLVYLRKMNQIITMNSVITQSNYKEIPELTAFLIKIWVINFQFAFVHILWSAAENKENVVPKKSDIMPYIHKALDIAQKHRAFVRTEAIPYCLMQGYEWAIAESLGIETAIVDAGSRVDSYLDYRWNEWKAKWPQCTDCSKNNVCEWPWKEYPEMYGWEEFKAV